MNALSSEGEGVGEPLEHFEVAIGIKLIQDVSFRSHKVKGPVAEPIQPLKAGDAELRREGQ